MWTETGRSQGCRARVQSIVRARYCAFESAPMASSRFDRALPAAATLPDGRRAALASRRGCREPAARPLSRATPSLAPQHSLAARRSHLAALDRSFAGA
jgi:hypothetical protein